MTEQLVTQKNLNLIKSFHNLKKKDQVTVNEQKINFNDQIFIPVKYCQSPKIASVVALCNFIRFYSED